MKYKEWRTDIFNRDNYTCVLCGKHGGRLQADHIVQKAIFIKICNYDFEDCMEYQPLWDLKNGRTLCYKCHKSTPTYGKLL